MSLVVRVDQSVRTAAYSSAKSREATTHEALSEQIGLSLNRERGDGVSFAPTKPPSDGV